MSFAYVTLVLAVLCGSAQAVQFYLEFGQQLCFQEPLPSDTKVTTDKTTFFSAPSMVSVFILLFMEFKIGNA